MVQCLAERRHGARPGIRQVRCLEGEAVWAAGRAGPFDMRLLDEAATRFRQRPLNTRRKNPGSRPKTRPVYRRVPRRLESQCPHHGWRRRLGRRMALRRRQIRLNAVLDARRTPDDALRVFAPKHRAACPRPRQPVWPLERTLLTTGALDALLISRHRGGQAVTTPYLGITYSPTSKWREPPPPPPGRPVSGP